MPIDRDPLYRYFNCNLQTPYIKCRRVYTDSDAEDVRVYTGRFTGRSTVIDPGGLLNNTSTESLSGLLEVYILKSDNSAAGWYSFHVYYANGTFVLRTQSSAVLTGINTATAFTTSTSGVYVDLPFVCKLSYKFSCTFK